MLFRSLFRLPGVTHVRSSIVLREIKADAPLPIAQVPGKPLARAARRRAAG